MEQALAQAPLFLLVFIRISAFMTFIPFFNDPNFIMNAKIIFAFFLSLLIFPAISTAHWVIPGNILGFIFLVTQEIFVGILMGLTIMIMIFILQLTGRMLGFQMAFSMANVMDSTFGENSNVLSVLMMLVGVMLLISLGGDHYLLYSLKNSFDILPPGSFTVTKPLLKELSVYIMHAFEVGFKLAVPAIILLLCIDFTLGLIGKTSTKMQIFFVGLPLKISVGLFMFTVITGFIASIWAEEIFKIPDFIVNLFKLMRI